MVALGIPAGVLAHAAEVAAPFGVDAIEILTGRAALLGITPSGRVSAGGATRLLAAADTWCALTLSRSDDIDAVPALLGADTVAADPWPVVTEWVARRSAAEAVERARLLGLPAAVLGETPPALPRRVSCGAPSSPRDADGLLVVDLTSMWAGPLCGQLLARRGATVVKVESTSRPDGTRQGDVRFFDWMNTGKLCYTADFDQPQDLTELLSVADVVLEGSRPAALQQRGLGPRQIAGAPGRVWLRITGYGTAPDCVERVAFGDDAAVAGGLVLDGADGLEFAGDAIADPLTGLAAAVLVLASLRAGGGELIELAMAEVAAGYAALGGPLCTVGATAPDACPRASELGADRQAVRQLIAQRGHRC